ncbi:MAG: toll/interleukin-1 receptor domain-containing protein [Balneola sp.]
MPLFKASEARSLSKAYSGYKTSSQILTESYKEFSFLENYDIFLSHSFSDADIINGIKKKLELSGYSVYVDWIEDYQLDRRLVSSHTARLLRNRMRRSKSLFYVTSSNSTKSKWMPWETGYFDGFKGKVAIFPVNEEVFDKYQFKGQEFLNLYPYITLSKDGKTLYVVDEENNWKELSSWIN